MQNNLRFRKLRKENDMKDKDKNEGKGLQIFNNPEFGEIRTTVIDGEPWFVGKDVAMALGYGNPRQGIASHVDAEDKGVQKCKVRRRQLKPWARKVKNYFEKFGELVLMAFMGIGTAVLLAQFFGVMIGAIDPRP